MQYYQGLHCLPFSTFWSGSTLLAILSSLIKVKVYTVILRNNLIRVYTICHSQQSGQWLHYLPFSAVWLRSRSILSFSGTVWSGSTLFVILSSLISIYIVCHSQQSNQGLYCLPFSAIWSRSKLFAILSSLIKVYTVCHSQQSNEGLHYLPFSAVRSGSTLFAIISSLSRVYTIYNSLSYEGLHYLPFSAVWSRNTLFAILSQQYYRGLHCLQLSAVWFSSTLFVILNSLIRVYTVCHSQQYDQGVHYLPFSVRSGSTLFAILSMIRATLFTILSSLIYSIFHSQLFDQGLLYLRFFLSNIINVYTVCHSQQSDQGL